MEPLHVKNNAWQYFFKEVLKEALAKSNIAGQGLGIVTMEGREAKHIALKKTQSKYFLSQTHLSFSFSYLLKHLGTLSREAQQDTKSLTKT